MRFRCVFYDKDRKPIEEIPILACNRQEATNAATIHALWFVDGAVFMSLKEERR